MLETYTRKGSQDFAVPVLTMAHFRVYCRYVRTLICGNTATRIPGKL